MSKAKTKTVAQLYNRSIKLSEQKKQMDTLLQEETDVRKLARIKAKIKTLESNIRNNQAELEACKKVDF